MVGGGFLAARRAEGGGGGSPDGRLPEYTSMTALDAGLTVVGRRAQLVGATTGEVILTCLRVAAGAGGLAIEGPVRLWQATGTEFDGAFAWVSLGSAGAVGWGTPGNETTGGLIPPVGTVMLGGFRRLHPIQQRAQSARWRVEAVPASPATGMCLATGCTPADQTPLRLIGGGIGWSGVANYRLIVHAGATSYDAPAQTAGGSNLSPPALPYVAQASHAAVLVASASMQVVGGAQLGDAATSGGGIASASSSSALPTQTNLAPTVTRVGDWTARLLTLSWPAEAL